ncbi:MAG: M23 family metallopeptidase [Gemmatimonadota bacterium]|nr:M23 family metallopeptidase [Gemmatimonadota bacterium]
MSAVTSTPGASRAASVVSTTALACSLLLGCGGSVEESGTTSAGFGHRPLVQPSTRLVLKPEETLSDFLLRGGLSAPDARRVIDIARPFGDWTAPDPGVEARFHRWPGEPPERIHLKIDPDRTLSLDLVGAVWQVAVDSVPVVMDTVVVSGVLESSLYAAHLAGDAEELSVAEKAALVGQLADVFAWQIDFYRDPRPGDAFRIALERVVRPDGSLRGSTVLAAEYSGPGELLQAFRFSPSNESGSLYFDEGGSALRGAFLRAPLDLVRVTSRFSGGRYHPVLRSYRSHAGVDYGAPSGTPVRATGDGRVVKAGWAGDLGLMVELDHGRGIRTRYAHLSGISDDVAAGRTVTQRDIIGVVGSTGLSTASHLHYEFRRNGRAVDPTSVDLPVERPIDPLDEERFADLSGEARSVLGRAFWPAPVPGSPYPSGTATSAR